MNTESTAAPIESVSTPSTISITVFTRHREKCPQRDNPQWKRCGCRKSLYIYEGGKKSYVSAKTRSWEQAEKFAQAEWDKRDLVKIELKRIAEQEAAKEAARLGKTVTLSVALKEWLGGMKSVKGTSLAAYDSTTKRILRWAESKQIVNVSDVTRNCSASGTVLGAWTLRRSRTV